MKGWTYLKKYYQSSAEESLRILANKQIIHQMMMKNVLVLFLRYLESLNKLDEEMIVKNLLLTIQFCKVDSSKISNLFPYKLLDVSRLALLNGRPKERQIIQKLINYINYLLLGQLTLETQLTILTNDIVSLLQLVQSKKSTISIYGQFFYQSIEEKLNLLWEDINRSYSSFQQYQQPQFVQFYAKYVAFCHYKRKLPKIKHKNLKSIEIPYQMNRKIEQKRKLQQTMKQLQNVSQSKNRNNFLIMLKNVDWEQQQ